MLVACFLFAVMSVGIKLVSDFYSVGEILMARGVAGAAVTLLYVACNGGTLKTTLVRPHLWRSVIGSFAVWLWVASFSLLPIATAVTLNYTSSVWLALILFIAAWWRGQEKLEWGFGLTILLSFVGVTLLLRPSMGESEMIGGILALSSGLVSALAYLQVRQLGKSGEPEYRIVFYFSLTCFVAGLAGNALHSGDLVPFRATQGWREVTWLVMIGTSAALAQLALTRAYHLGNAFLSANLQYMGIVFSAFLGVVIWADKLDGLAWCGIAVILIGGVLATYYNQRGNR
jgi:S-adenosylmethionine uptake transporter